MLSFHLPAEMFSSKVIWLIYSAHFNSKPIIVSIRTFHVFISFKQIKHSKLCLLKILAIKGVIKTWTSAVSKRRLILKSSKVIVPKNLTTSSEHFWGCMEYSMEYYFFPIKLKDKTKQNIGIFTSLILDSTLVPSCEVFLYYSAIVNAQILLILPDSLRKCRRLSYCTVGSGTIFQDCFTIFLRVTFCGMLKVN